MPRNLSRDPHLSLSQFEDRREVGFLNLYSWVATATLFVQIPTITRVTIGTVLFLPLIPKIWPLLSSRPWLKSLNRWAIAAVIVTFALPIATLALDSGRNFDWGFYWTTGLAVIQFYLILISTVFSIEFFGLGTSLLLLSIGAAINFFQITEGDPTVNPWKYYLVWPVSLLTMLIASKLKYPLALLPIIALIAISAATGSRNAFLVLCLVVFCSILLGVDRVRQAITPQLLRRFFMLALTSLLFVVPLFLNWVGQGGLGQDLQSRQLEQLQVGFLGSRVEPTVGLGLVLSSPVGIGAGVQPSPSDTKSGLSSFSSFLNPDALSTAYVQMKVLGSTVELHSVALDFWVVASFVGIFFALKCLKLLFMALASVSKTNQFYACLFLFFQAFWDMLFSPLVVNAKYCAVAIAVAIYLERKKLKVG